MRLNRLIFALVFGAILVSCSLQETCDPVEPGDTSGRIDIVGVPAECTRLNVGTKADNPETDIDEVTLIIFNKSGQLAGEAVNLSGNASFTIDKNNAQIVLSNGQPIPLGTGDLSSCTVYMFANSWSKIKPVVDSKGADLVANDVLSVKMDVVGLGIPTGGFPMIGKEEGVNLTSAGASDFLTIRLNKLYAKINVIMQVSADQVVETPYFHMDAWQVCNVPTQVSFADSDGQTIAATNSTLVRNSQEIYSPTEGLSTITNSDTDDPETFTLSFYLPEHVVLPAYTEDNYPFPYGLPSSEHQRYKPKMFSEGNQFPTYVLIKGSYSDHRGQLSSVEYRLYLGQDNTDDFRILRNQELNNKVVIKGITDSKEAVEDNVDGVDNVSVDHRVSITSVGYSVAIERESLLDSHFEYRPIDISVQKGSKVTIEVANPESCDWIRFDVNDQIKDYFTTDLVSSTLRDNTYFELNNIEGTAEIDQRIWVYIDENDNYYDELIPKDTQDSELKKHTVTYRENDLIIKFYENSEDTTPEEHYYTFRQNNLWRVWGGAGSGTNAGQNRYYDIENHEEYLYNYASDDTWDSITDGMAWGLMSDIHLGANAVLGVSLSDTYKSFNLSSTIGNYILEESKPYYDFYISSDEANGSTAREYSGRTFSNEIMEKLIYENLYTYQNGMAHNNVSGGSSEGTTQQVSRSQVLSDGKLVSTPLSAVEYCYHKNKRDKDGNIITASGNTYNTSNVKWFLPSIDQIEEIVIGAYHKFEEFQDKWYWSSQPAYDRYQYLFWLLGTSEGYFYQDDLSNARATKVTADPVTGIKSPAPSGSDVDETSALVGSHKWYSILLYTYHDYTANTSYNIQELHDGNKHRSSINRVRCVYRTGYGTKP